MLSRNLNWQSLPKDVITISYNYLIPTCTVLSFIHFTHFQPPLPYNFLLTHESINLINLSQIDRKISINPIPTSYVSIQYLFKSYSLHTASLSASSLIQHFQLSFSDPSTTPPNLQSPQPYQILSFFTYSNHPSSTLFYWHANLISQLIDFYIYVTPLITYPKIPINHSKIYLSNHLNCVYSYDIPITTKSYLIKLIHSFKLYHAFHSRLNLIYVIILMPPFIALYISYLNSKFIRFMPLIYYLNPLNAPL